MRFCWVGLLIVLMAPLLLAQAQGEVESIGFGTYYRPECWVPMRVVLQATGDAAADVQIRVIQEDLDRDRVVATRTVTVTPDVSGRQEKQAFWMYFRPQASGSGLKDNSVDPSGSSKQLQAQLKVVLMSGGKTLSTLPITQQMLRRVDIDSGSSGSGELRGVKMVLCVTDGKSLPAHTEYASPLTGLAEQPLFVMVRPDELPEDVRAYEMTDAILWMGAQAPDPARGLEQPRYRAIEQYVQQGGMLVVCQGPELSQTRGFGSLLPVTVIEERDSSDIAPLQEMSQLDSTRMPEGIGQARRVAYARAKPEALVLRAKNWGKESSPYLVRGRVGTGCVTWVAQDLGEPGLVRTLRHGWVRIWDEVMGWRNNPTEVAAADIQAGSTTAFWPDQASAEMGAAFRRAGELGSRAAGYVLVSVVFFLAYWVAAGPGLYAWLSMRKLATLNWFLFGVAAVAAAALAMLMVRFVQSGAAELDHVTIVRAAAGEPAAMQSQVSLLIRSDGLKQIALGQGQAHAVNWVTPFPEHPFNNQLSGKFLAMRQYELPIQDAANDEPVSVRIPWRSTTKRLQVRWTGDLTGRIEGQVQLVNRRALEPEIAGTLTNGTGLDLHDIYLVYRGMDVTGDGENGMGDRVLYIPSWPKGQTKNLTTLSGSDQVYLIGRDPLARAKEATPRNGQIVYGRIEAIHRGFGNGANGPNEVAPGEGWAGYWYSNSKIGNNNIEPMHDAGSAYDASLPLCSLFERVPPMRNTRDNGGWKQDRRQILRVGARWMDVSPAVASGSLVVLAQGNGPLPIPLTAEGDELKGKGVILYQFILPLRRGAMGVER